MNPEIMKQAGFGDMVDKSKKGFCTFCVTPIDLRIGFRNEISRKEYMISGLCQKYQDELFGKD